MKIVSAAIQPEAFWADMGLPGPNEIVGTFEDGFTAILFSYYPDELTFTADEFVGLTVHEARALHSQRDIAWLRS